jgi:hypothetical protein
VIFFLITKNITAMMNLKFLCGLGFSIILPIVMFQNPIQNTGNQLSGLRTAPPDCSKETGLAKVVCLAEAFKATLNKEQLASLQLKYSKTDAVKWSNLPQAYTRPKRPGLDLEQLNPKQLSAFKTLMSAVLARQSANEGYDELEGVLAADDYLSKANGNTETLGSGKYYIDFLGEPSTAQLWELQFGGHHFAFADTYDKGKITGATPSFRGVEPMIPVTANGHTYQPLEQEKMAFIEIIKTLSDAEKKAAVISSSFNDILLGPGQDGNFPLKKPGIKIGNLNRSQQKQLIHAIELYVNDLDSATAKNIMKKYTEELADTYFAYSGTGTMYQNADYVRIDGPGVWIECAVQSGRDFQSATHVHSVWRDHQTDYGGN